MYESKNELDSLVHLYVDGAFSRRELVQRVTKLTGSVAAAMAALGSFAEVLAQSPPPVPPGVRVAEDDPSVEASDVEFNGEAGHKFAYAAWPRSLQGTTPGVLVVHENRGLVDHIKDVTRRVAKSGFVGVAVDLLSRQGGTQLFTDPTAQTAAYNRTTQYERRSDLIDGLAYIKTLPVCRFDRIGMVGFCAGGGNTWDFVVNIDELVAAVPFYGTPPAVEDLPKIKTPVMAIYAELDRTLTQRSFPVATALNQQQKTMGLFVYEGVNHAFHNDTGAAYNPDAASDAWGRTIAFFNKFLRR
jgi:carboxymethylenebutenolidase